MKRFVLTFICIAVLFSSMPQKTNAVNMTGSGTLSDPYVITNGEQFSSITDKKAYYIITENISVSRPLDSFEGTIVGMLNKEPESMPVITLNIHETNQESVALIRSMSGGEIRNIKTVGSVSSSGNGDFAAALVGSALSGAVSIVNCVNEASVAKTSKSEAPYYATGGLAGRGAFNISNSVNRGMIMMTQNGRIGGILGHTTGNISNCINYGSIFGYSITGGIAGGSSGTIKDCANYGEIQGTSNYTGGLVGVFDGVQFSKCFNEGKVFGLDYVGGLIGRTSATGTLKIENCYNTGIVKTTGILKGAITGHHNRNQLLVKNFYDAQSRFVGLVGGMSATATALYESVYYYSEERYDDQIEGTKSLTGEEMKSFEFYKGFDENDWKAGSDENPYPTLINGEGHFKSQRLNQVYFSNSEYLGTPLERVMPRHCILVNQDGHDILYTTSNGVPTIFNAYDLTDRKLLASHELKGKSSWSHGVDSKGTVYVTLDGYLYRYFPKTREMEYLGSTPNNGATYGVSVDDEDNVYIGTFPQGKIFKYDSSKNQLIDMGVVKEGDQYVRSLIYHKGYLYASTYSNNATITRINPKNFQDRKTIDLDLKEGVYLSMSYITPVRDYLIINARVSDGSNPLLVYDVEKETFVEHDYKGIYKGIYCTPENEGKFYFNDFAGRLFEYNLETNKVTDTGMVFPSQYSVDFNGGGFVEIPDHPDYPGKTLVTVKPDTPYPILVNFETKKFGEMTDAILAGSSVTIHSLSSGPGNLIGIGGYMGVEAGTYNTLTGEFKLFESHQPEKIIALDDKMYFGLYTGAKIQEYDPSKPIDANNPKIIKAIGNEQDRPFGLAGGENKLFVGTVPVTNKAGGTFSIFDKNTGQWQTHRNIVQDQSVISLVYHNGMVYGGTSIFGGYGQSKPEKPCIFVWDIEKNKKVREIYPEIPGIDYQILAYNKLLIGPDGLLWVGARNILFALNLETFKVEKVLELSSSEWSRELFVWRSTYMEFDKNGLLYLALNKTSDLADNGIYIIDPDTLEYKNISDKAEGYRYIRDMTIGGDGNIYYGVGGAIHKITVSDREYDITDLFLTVQELSDSVALFVGNNHAIVKGAVKEIDSENPAVVPFVEEGRTLVPLRFIGECLGAQVKWSEENNEVVLKSQETSLRMKIGSRKMELNGAIVELDKAPETVNGRIMIPLRTVAEAFGQQVFWNEEGLIVFSKEPWNKTEEVNNKIVFLLKNRLKK